MNSFSSIRDVVDLWPTRGALADDMRSIAPFAPVTAERVSKWPSAQAIPARFHHALLEAAKVRGFPLTADDLVRLHAAKPQNDGLLSSEKGAA
jgi:hypothetical protein